MKALLSLLQLLFLCGVVATASAASDTLQQQIEQVLLEEGLTGISWALLDETGELQLGTAGVRDNSSQAEFEPQHRFHVGSVTKSVLATGVLRLVTIGKIELDAPVERYLPAMAFDNPWHNSSPVTVRHLLDHSSGIEDARLWQMFSERPLPKTPLSEAFPDPGGLLKVRSRPGTRFSYSNMGYTLLGMLIEAVSDETYESWLDRELLAPLAMLDSSFEYTSQEGESADPLLAWGHIDDGSTYGAVPLFLRPAAQFTTTSGDLARFMKFLLGDGRSGEEVFIRPELMRSRGHAAATDAAANGLSAGYALGLGRRDRHAVIGYCHGGNTVGFVAMLCVFPEAGKGFAYSVNTDNETANYGRLDAVFISALGISAAKEPATVVPAADVAEWQGIYILSPNRFSTFEYIDRLFGAIEVSSDSGELTLTYLQQGPRQLRPLGGYLFSAADRATTSHVLMRGDAGEYLIADGFKTYQKVATPGIAAQWLILMGGLAGTTYLLLAGLVALLRSGWGARHRPEAPAFTVLLLCVGGIPVFATQSFMALGDLTPASALLAVTSALLPIGFALTLARVISLQERSRFQLSLAIAAGLALVWFAVLVVEGLLPLRLWS